MDTDPKKIVVKKPGAKSPVVINPPEKTLTGGHNEAFETSLQKHTSICETKTKIILQAKAAKFDIPEQVALKVFVRGLKAFPSSSLLTREQYAMDHVNSFINGGAAMEKEWDLIPIQIDERLHTRMGTKGTGGAGRAHIKREKSPYNGKMIYHVVDRRGVIKHSTQDEMQAKRHLASKYRSYMESTSDRSFIVIDEARASAALKLSQAWDQRKQSSEASRARAAAAKAEFEKQWQEKQSKPKQQGVDEAAAPVTHRIGLTVTDPNHPMVSKRGETYQKSVRVTGPDRKAAINQAIAHHRRKGYKVHDHHYLGTVGEPMAEAAKWRTHPDAHDLGVAEEVEELDELNKDTLYSYFNKSDRQITAKHRVLGPQIKAGDAKAANKTSALIGKRMAGMDRAADRLNKEEVETVEKKVHPNIKHINMLHLKMQRKLKITDND